MFRHLLTNRWSLKFSTFTNYDSDKFIFLWTQLTRILSSSLWSSNYDHLKWSCFDVYQLINEISNTYLSTNFYMINLYFYEHKEKSSEISNAKQRAEILFRSRMRLKYCAYRWIFLIVITHCKISTRHTDSIISAHRSETGVDPTANFFSRLAISR